MVTFAVKGPEVRQRAISSFSLFSAMCERSYGGKHWFGKTLRGGWPDIDGPVTLGEPIKNKFGELVIIYLNEQGYPKCRVLETGGR